MDKDEMKMIKDIMAVIVRHHSGLGCDVLCDGDQCENCYLTAKDLYYEGYRKVADDEIVVKMTDIMDLNNKAQGTTDFLRDKLAEISKQIDEATKIADDEIVIKKSEYEELTKTYATINNEAYYCGLSVGREEVAREILQEVVNAWNTGNLNQRELAYICTKHGIELEE